MRLRSSRSSCVLDTLFSMRRRARVSLSILGFASLAGIAAACGTDDGATPNPCGDIGEVGCAEAGAPDSTAAPDTGVEAGAAGDAASDADAGETAPPSSCVDGGPPGTLDTSFGDNGIVMLKNQGGAASVALQPDGKIVVGGAIGSQTSALVRLLPDGKLDTSFGVGGLVESKLVPTYNTAFTAVAIQSDGKILAAGAVDLEVDKRSRDLTIARYLPNGTLDVTFGQGGFTATDFGSDDYSAEYPNSMVLLPDGRIVVAGHGGSPTDLVAARFKPDGSLDDTFGTNGRLRVDTRGRSDSPGMIVRTPNGGFVIAGTSLRPAPSTTGDMAAVAVTSNGLPDGTFANGGQTFVDWQASSTAQAVAVDPLGRLLVAGRVAPGDFAIARLSSGGAVDTSFGPNGLVRLDFGGRDDEVDWAGIRADGRLVVVGQSLSDQGVGTPDMGIAAARLGADGSLDMSFGSGGKFLVVPPPNVSYGVNAAVMDACSVVAVGGWIYRPGGAGIANAMGIVRIRL